MHRLLILALVLFSLMAPAGSWSSDAVEFSALIIEKDNGVEQRGKIFVAENMSRYELEGSNEIVVTRHDKKVIWLIFPKLRKYVEQPYLGEPKQNYAGAHEADTGDLSKEFIEHEMVDSYRLKKYLVTVKYNKGKSKDQYHEWYRDNFPVPVKTQSLDGMTSYEYVNIKLGRPPAEFFSEPRGYKKITVEELAEIEESNSVQP
ncbi:MAG: hypothetical protein AB7U31_06560 [Synergistaceae bacterium]